MPPNGAVPPSFSRKPLAPRASIMLWPPPHQAAMVSGTSRLCLINQVHEPRLLHRNLRQPLQKREAIRQLRQTQNERGKTRRLDDLPMPKTPPHRPSDAEPPCPARRSWRLHHLCWTRLLGPPHDSRRSPPLWFAQPRHPPRTALH